MISIPSITQSHPTMSICTRISLWYTSMCYLSLMIKVALDIPWWSTVKTTSVWPIYFDGKITLHQLPASFVCFQILQNTIFKSIFVIGASVTFHRRTSLHDTRSFAPETTSFQCSICFRCQAQKRRKSNLTSSSVVLRHRSSSMRTSSPSLSCPFDT